MKNENGNLEDKIPSDLKGRYIDFQFVGQGGMGQIISAHDTLLNKSVAIKILPTMTVSDTAVIRFHQEAKAVSKLNHQHIVQVLDFGFASTGDPYLVMEMVKGQTLDSLLETNKKLPLKTVVALAIQICSGIQHAHSNKIIHRDLKPGNIMLDENQVVKVLDFGLAKIMDQENVDWRLTRPGHAMGSPLYMSPEQLRGEEVDERSDVYSLGLVIYKMITGSVPFEDENIMRILMGRLQEAPPALPVDESAPLLSEALADIIAQTLKTDREERMQNMSDLKEALIETESIKVETPTGPIEPQNWFKAKLLTKPNMIGLAIFTFVIGVCCIPLAKILDQYSEVVSQKNREPEDPNAMLPNTSGDLTATSQDKRGVVPYGFRRLSEKSDYLVAEPTTVDKDLYGLLPNHPEEISLQTNKHITVRGIEILSQIENLRYLNLRETLLGDEIIPYINKMERLEYLDLRYTKVTDDGIKAMKPSNRLRMLVLGYQYGITDVSLANIVKKFPRIHDLELSTTKVTGKGLALLKPLRLRNLVLTALKITDKDIDTIVMLHPVDITLESNPVTDAGLDKLKAISDLKKLNVEFCKQISSQKLDEFEKKFPGIEIIRPMRPHAEENLNDLGKIFEKDPDKL